MFTTQLQPTITFNAPQAYNPAPFVKLPELAAAEITERIHKGVKVPRGKRFITYTSNTLNVLRAIISRLDRAHNFARITFDDLKQLTGIRNRSTLADHLYLLESDVRYIDVKRERVGLKNKPNIYRLVGRIADCVLDNKRAKIAKKADLQSPMIGLNTESMFGCLLDKVSQQTKDFGIAQPVLQNLIEEHGVERVDAVVAYVLKQTWNPTNPQGLAVKLIRDPNFDPNEQPQKPSAQPVDLASKFLEMDVNVVVEPEPEAPTRQQETSDLPWLNEIQKQAMKPTGIQDQAWEFAHTQLKLQLDRQTFDLWLKSTVLVGVNDNKYQVWCESERRRDMCQHMLYRNIRRVLADVIGVAPEAVVIEFVTSEDLAVSA